MTVLWGLGALAVVVLVLLRVTRRGAEANALLVLTIEIQPSGVTKVIASPQPAIPQLVAVTALCYLAKLRWLLESEPPEVLSAFREFVREALDFWPPAAASLKASMPLALSLEEQISPGEWTVLGSELFIVRALPLREGGVYIYNDLPNPVLAANLAWNAVVLLDHLSIELDAPSRDRFISALDQLHDVLFGPPVSQKLADLKRLNGAANQAWVDAAT